MKSVGVHRSGCRPVNLIIIKWIGRFLALRLLRMSCVCFTGTGQNRNGPLKGRLRHRENGMPGRIRRVATAAMACALPWASSVSVQARTSDPAPECDTGQCVTRYPADFFGRYAPVNALDMVQNLPGFVLDNGDRARGFAGTAGNVLINGERLSAKSGSPSDILLRIPAKDVERIELIRGQTGALNLPGQSVIANIIRRSGRSGTWTTGLYTRASEEEALPYGNGSYTDSFGPLQVTLGAEVERFLGLTEGEELVLAPDGTVLEVRNEQFKDPGYFLEVTSNVTWSKGRTIANFNGLFNRFSEAGGETSLRTPAGGATFELFQGDTDEENAFEIGADVERALTSTVSAKLIGLYNWEDYRETGSLVRGLVGMPGVTESAFVTDTLDTEAIARIEIDYTGIKGHALEVALEAALNRLESAFALAVLENGVLTPQDVPGAQTEVEEERLDVALTDTFRIGPLSVDAVLGAETSTIRQTGGFEEERSFFFWKPSLTLTYPLGERTQLRGRALRQIGQLNFFDFVSATDLGDNELALGNPDLAPEVTTTFDLTLDQRFGSIATVNLTAFYDRISDVQDLLPLQGILEVPGNIGDGTRAGIRGELTLPLDWIGLKGGRIDANGSWQTSSVSDPLTGADRRLSGERRWEVEMSLRQDLAQAKIAWGITLEFFDDEPFFGLDEIDTFNQERRVDGFVEYRGLEGLRFRVGFDNALGGQSRDRRVFAGGRGTAPLAFIEARENEFPTEVFFEVSGNF